MEGLLDHTLRDVLTRVGGVDRCVSEFIRVTDQLLPVRSFTRLVPELRHGSRTPAGVPVRPQLLGSDPACLADNAARLAALGPAGIDLNFGCPAKTVNRHRGGAVLLDEPELLHRIVAAVRRAVPAGVPVSAKMRLGFNDDARTIECAQAIEAGGADELVVHARTKAQAYRPPAYWERVADIRARVALPVVANGDIWSAEDAARCRAVTGCHAIMIGRGMVRDPGLALAIARPGSAPVPWVALLPLIAHFWHGVSARVAPRHRAGRLKQWLHALRTRYPEAAEAFETLRLVHDPARIEQYLQHLGQTTPAAGAAGRAAFSPVFS
ncbi:tRNA dihydrouridine(16) synthase DusC [Comamonadaceae bacterium OH2545_COT-014]|nr:tRNA dihydrouridine(16) synthase DusC [Comamonadaceae bacterium OH2545_COT-014]